MSKRLTSLFAATAIVSLGACTDGQVGTSLTQQAGAFLDQGEFGNATMNNMLVQTGQRSYLLNLNQRFNAEVPAVVNFAFNSSHLDAEAQAILRQQANWIRQFPEVRFRVYGHTDLVGSDAYNRRLGRRRAQAVVAYLSSQGISRSRLEALVSYGEQRPIIYTQEPARQNRRAVTEVSGFVKRHPTVLNGKYAEVIFREYVESATEVPPSAGGGLAAIQAQGG